MVAETHVRLAYVTVHDYERDQYEKQEYQNARKAIYLGQTIFQQCALDEIRLVHNLFKLRYFNTGQFIYQQGEAVQGLYLIKRGTR